MTMQIGFKVDTSEEYFLERLQQDYSGLNPNYIEYSSYKIHFIHELDVQKSEGSTRATVMIKDTISNVMLPVISFSI